MIMRLPFLLLFLAGPLLSGCADTYHHDQPQYAQKAQLSAPDSLAMEQACRENAAYRYNTRPQQIRAIGFTRFQGSYELRGYTIRREGFTCVFDVNGHFLYLSMR